MTAATVAVGAAPSRSSGVTFGRVLTAEWIKFRTVRATLWTLPLTLVAMVGVATLSAWGMSTLDSHESFTAADAVTGGTQFGQLVVIVLAILTITGEYSTGQIRSSITAVPRRTPVLAAKAIVLAGALFWGILLSALARTQLVAYQLAMISSFLPAFLLSGFIFAIENMPVPIQVVTYLFPTRYFITILMGIFLRGVGLEILWFETALLALYGGAGAVSNERGRGAHVASRTALRRDRSSRGLGRARRGCPR